MSAAVHQVPAYVPEAVGRITHDVAWDCDSFDLFGNQCVAQGSFQACGAEMAEELKALCERDSFKRNVRIVPRAS